MIVHGVPEHIRSDQGSEFVAKVVQNWIAKVGAKTAYIEKGSPWENGYVESFNSKFRDELLDREIFYSLREAQVLTRASGFITIPCARIRLWGTVLQHRR